MKLYRIKRSKIDKRGRGLYATRDIKEGTKIINYVGKIITNKEVEESIKFDNKKPIYLFTLNKKYTLDGDFSWNTAGLINHSCNNNCDYDGKGLKIWITAIRDIKEGEEFTLEDTGAEEHSAQTVAHLWYPKKRPTRKTKPVHKTQSKKPADKKAAHQTAKRRHKSTSNKTSNKNYEKKIDPNSPFAVLQSLKDNNK